MLTKDLLDNTELRCENPKVIFHPYARQYFAKYGIFVIDGVLHKEYLPIGVNTRYNEFPALMKTVFQKPSCLPVQKLIDEKYYFLNGDEVLPMFLVVGCGHCALCDKDKRDDLSARCALETLESKYPPVFVTLTYDDEHLPFDGVQLKDMQDFCKLLRMNFSRYFSVPTGEFSKRGVEKRANAKFDLRIVYCAEYGKNTHRPHYHALIWNVPFVHGQQSDFQKHFFDKRGHAPKRYASMDSIVADIAKKHAPTPVDLRKSVAAQVYRLRGMSLLTDLIWCSWKKGFVSVQSCRDSSGRYVAKYIGKGSDVPVGKNPTFVHWSTRRGLGYKAYEVKFMDILKQNPSLTQLTFTDPKFGKQMRIKIPAYYRRLLAPSLSVLGRPFVKRIQLLHNYVDMINVVSRYYCSCSSLLWSDRWNIIREKYQLFDFTAKMSVHALSSIDAKRLASHCSDLVLNYSLWSDKELERIYVGLVSSANKVYDDLLNFPLQDLRLSDILQWKADHSFAVENFLIARPQKSLRDKLFDAHEEERKFKVKTRL